VRAVTLLSGGLDSTVATAIALERGFQVTAVSFRYGQRHSRELDSARAVARALRVTDHLFFDVNMGEIGGSALTDRAIDVPLGRDEREMAARIPSTYVPARNTVMLSFALAVAEVRDADAIFIGANALDYSGYPDCRPQYFEAFEKMANLATKRGTEGRPVKIEVPLQTMTKADIVREGVRVGAPLDLTWSCYVGGERACGECDSCKLRLKGFREAGLEDPIAYVVPKR
jgi:7-cyano-7-deazaguanine synthase